MENTLTFEELILILKGEREREHRRNKFYAMFKGVDLDEEENSGELSAFQQTQMAADAAMKGMSEEEYIFDMIGIDVDIDSDLEEEVN